MNGMSSSKASGAIARTSSSDAPRVWRTATASRSLPFDESHRGDSGMFPRIHSTRNAGATPMRKRMRQPWSGTSVSEQTAAARSPSGHTVVMKATDRPRVRVPTYSETRAVEMGIIPPKHMPVTNRRTPNCSALLATAVKPDSAAKPRMVPPKPALLPNLSASGPQMIAPRNMPQIPADARMPVVTGSSFHSAVIDGIAYETM